MDTTHNRLRHILVLFLAVLLSLTAIGNASAATFPEVIRLPNGFQPEGIASGRGTTFYVGSIGTGAVYRGDFRTGEGNVLVPPVAGRNAIGLKYDPASRLLFVAGGPTGHAYIYDAETGASVVALQLSAPPSFINDVVITHEAAYFTNSFQPVIYRIPLEDIAELTSADVETISLGGQYRFIPDAFNANGIAATPNGKTLIIVNSAEGALYKVDPQTGAATRIDLGKESPVPNGDGILLHGKTLYVVQNRLNQVAVIELASDLSSGTIESMITSTLFRVPTTIARFGESFYVVNARFGTTPGPNVDYDVVLVPEE